MEDTAFLNKNKAVYVQNLGSNQFSFLYVKIFWKVKVVYLRKLFKKIVLNLSEKKMFPNFITVTVINFSQLVLLVKVINVLLHFERKWLGI